MVDMYQSLVIATNQYLVHSRVFVGIGHVHLIKRTYAR